jgi:hypothetical protein
VPLFHLSRAALPACIGELAMMLENGIWIIGIFNNQAYFAKCLVEICDLLLELKMFPMRTIVSDERR